MVIKDLPPYSRKVRGWVFAVEIIIITIAAILLLICSIGPLLPIETDNESIKLLAKISSAIWAFGIISFVDLLSMLVNKKRWSLSLIGCVINGCINKHSKKGNNQSEKTNR